MADLVIANAKSFGPTVETQQAIAIRADSILAVGSNTQIIHKNTGEKPLLLTDGMNAFG